MLSICIILNGPPNCGKDTLADLLIPHGFEKHQMKEQLYVDTAAYFQMPLVWLKELAMDRDTKELPHPAFTCGGVQLSPRQALIHTSENFIKPTYGNDYFGKSAAKRCVRLDSDLTVFSDGGFPEEIQPLKEVFNDIVIFRLKRSGCSFSGDSRNYLADGKNTYDLSLVDGHPDIALHYILHVIRTFNRRDFWAAYGTGSKG